MKVKPNFNQVKVHDQELGEARHEASGASAADRGRAVGAQVAGRSAPTVAVSVGYDAVSSQPGYWNPQL